MKRSRLDLDDLVAAEREHAPRPDRERAKASWRRLQRGLAAGTAAPFDLPPSSIAPVGGGATWVGASLKVLVATVVTAGGVAIAVDSSDSNGSSRGDARASERGQTAAEPRTVVPEPSTRATATAPVEHAPVVPTQDGLPEIEPRTDEDADARAATGASPRSRARVRASTTKPEPAGIGRELQLLTAASESVKRGEHEAALAALHTHAREYPSGSLVEDREALRVIALCGAGRMTDGARAARAFTERFPSSVHTKRALEACSIASEETP